MTEVKWGKFGQIGGKRKWRKLWLGVLFAHWTLLLRTLGIASAIRCSIQLTYKRTYARIAPLLSSCQARNLFYLITGENQIHGIGFESHRYQKLVVCVWKSSNRFRPKFVTGWAEFPRPPLPPALRKWPFPIKWSVIFRDFFIECLYCFFQSYVKIISCNSNISLNSANNISNLIVEIFVCAGIYYRKKGNYASEQGFLSVRRFAPRDSSDKLSFRFTQEHF